MRIPTYNSTCEVRTGHGDSPPDAVVQSNLQCEIYETAITKRGGEVAPAGLAMWTFLTPYMPRPRDGYNGVQDIWYPNLAYWVSKVSTVDPTIRWYVRSWGYRWLGTPAQHARWYLLPFSGVTGNPQPQATPPQLGGVPVSFTTHRPFGSATIIVNNQPGVLYSDLAGGRGGYSGGNYSLWTHYIDFDSSLDVRDASSRAAGLDVISYSDGDDLVVPGTGASTKYVVVRVITYCDPGNVVIKRAYLLRDQPKWPGP